MAVDACSAFRIAEDQRSKSIARRSRDRAILTLLINILQHAASGFGLRLLAVHQCSSIKNGRFASLAINYCPCAGGILNALEPFVCGCHAESTSSRRMWFHEARADHRAGRTDAQLDASGRGALSPPLFATVQNQTSKSTLISEAISRRKKEIKMDWDRVEGNWKQIKGKVKEQ
jgi:hypothetical protein